MWQIAPDAEYIDVPERALCKGIPGGISLEGTTFFYVNRPADKGRGRDSDRRHWFGRACCPSNIARFMLPVPGYARGRRAGNLYINLFMSGTAAVK
jgi:DUF1680 family protein